MYYYYYYYSFIWTQTGQAYSFGNNFYAQLGYDFQRADFKEHQLAPHLFQSLPSSLRISQVACGERHSLFALEDGTVAACGHNDYGQIGSGSNESVVIPRFVECVGRVLKVTCGANHNLALTGEGRLFQWGCGRACGNLKKNILSPEVVPLPPLSSPVREIAGGCWHSMLLTDGGNVFSWGMGQEGQLGLGEDRNHVSAPCLLSYSRLAEVTQIQAGDDYGAAVTAGGELFLWGQVPCLSVSDHPGLKKLHTPQPVLLGGRKVCDIACGSWHIVALATGIRETNRECDHPEYKAVFRDLITNPRLTEHAEKENTLKHLKHRSQVMERPAGTEEQLNNDKSYCVDKQDDEKEEGSQERQNKDEGDGVLHDSAFTLSRSETGMDRRVNDHSSFKEGVGCRSAGQLELRKEPARRGRPSRDVVFTTLHVLPRSAGEQCRQTSSTLPRLRTEQEAHGRRLDEAQHERSTYLTELLQKSGSDSSISQSPKFRLKPRPPGRCTCPGAQRGASCHYSRTRLHAGPESPIYNSSPRLTPGHRLQTLPSFRPGSQASRPPSRSSWNNL